ncbi:MAG: capsular polysaccharide synthesis protein [Candidatus Woesearchaeota archaeon]
MARERIPRIIHYCWFGKGEMPELYKKCIDSWKKHLKGYKFVCWNEDNFDVNSHHFTKEAYAAKKYAFVSDYVRLWALYNYGGIYIDADVEVLRPLDEFLRFRAFTGCENEGSIPTGIMGAEPHHPWIELLLKYYDYINFDKEKICNLVNVLIITDLTIFFYDWKPKGGYQILRDDIHIFPYYYFCPIFLGKLKIRKKTYSIHHFGSSWVINRKGNILKRSLRKFLNFLSYDQLIALRKLYFSFYYLIFFKFFNKKTKLKKSFLKKFSDEIDERL